MIQAVVETNVIVWVETYTEKIFLEVHLNI